RWLVVGGRKHESAYTVLGDVWSFDLAAGMWKQLSPTGAGPAPRQSHRVVYDAAGDRLLLFGGNTDTFFGNGVNGETWELDFAGGADGAWKQVTASPSPSPRQDVASAVASKHGVWIVTGGAF